MIIKYTHIPDVTEPDDSAIFKKLAKAGWNTDPRNHTAELEVRTPMEGMVAWKEATELEPEPGHKFVATSEWSSTMYWYCYCLVDSNRPEWVLG